MAVKYKGVEVKEVVVVEVEEIGEVEEEVGGIG